MISIQNVSFHYKKKAPVLKDVSLRFDMGNVYGILGANGVGKTTLLRLLSGLIFPKKGSIKIGDAMPSDRTVSGLKEVFYVPTEIDLPAGRIQSYKALHRVFYPKFDDATWEGLLESFNLQATANIAELSFGQKKKVLLSFALSTGCSVLLFDEPTDGLDIPARAAFRKQLAASISDNKVALITTHAIREIEYLLSHLTLLEGNQVLLHAPIQELSSQFYSERRPQLLGSSTILYSERVAEGFHCLLKNEAQETDHGLDIELLFKAISHDSTFIQHFTH